MTSSTLVRSLIAVVARQAENIGLRLGNPTLLLFTTLIAKRHAETLSPEEHEQLIQLSDRLEKLNVDRIQALIQLATLRNQPLTDLMQTLGISPDPEVMDYA